MKRPQPTAVLVKRLTRLGKVLEHESTCFHTPTNAAKFRAWATTCRAAADRLASAHELDKALTDYQEGAGR